MGTVGMASEDRRPWCLEPFTTLESKVYGPWGLCCRSKPLPYTPKTHSPLEHFNSPTMQRIRKNMLEHNITDEIKNLCQKCVMHEKVGIVSRREQKRETPLSSVNWEVLIEDDALRFETVEVKLFGNLCNLKCKMCDPIYSSSIAAERRKNGEWTGPVHFDMWKEFDGEDTLMFYEDMKKILPNTLYLKFTGGEPMMNSGIVDFLEWCYANGYSDDITLEIITNGTRINNDLLNYAKNFHSFHATVSMDGIFDVNDYQREGSEFETIDQNIEVLREYGMVSINAAITALNVTNLDELEMYARVKGVALDMTSIVTSPSYLQVNVLPPKYRQMLLDTQKYQFNVSVALQDPEWNEDLFTILLKKHPEILSLLPELEDYV